ncbi:MAG: thrombospondin type 3 repeat-containing protein [Bacteroidales bacterium]
MRHIILILLSYTCSISLFSQNPEKETEQHSPVRSVILQEYEPAFLPEYTFPKLTVGSGIFSFHGDVSSDFSRDITQGLPGFHIELEQQISPFYSLGFRYLRGKIYGNKHVPNTNLICNFQSQISAYSTYLHYNFGNNKHLAPYHTRVVSPFMSIGLEIMQSPEPWGDLKNSTGDLYKWTDGSFRNIPQNPTTAHSSKIRFRDYEYETSYIRENIDNSSTLSPLIISMPIELGAQIKLSPTCQINVAYQYHISFSDKLDNIHTTGENYETFPERKSNGMPDGFSYAHMSVSFNINNMQTTIYPDSTNTEQVYAEYWDADNDGIPELLDECPFTPEGIEVDTKGCPLDSDNDNIPDYIDVENKKNQFYTDKTGKSFSKQDIIHKITKGETINYNQIYKYYPDLLNGGTVFRQFYKKIPNKFRAIDSDRNLYIDIEELLHAIDTFFDEGDDAGIGAQLSVEDLFELIEFFFLQ